MARSPSAPQVATASHTVEPVVSPSAVCPLCHTASPSQAGETPEAVGWRCARCGQRWDALRLATVAAHAAWALERANVAAATAARQSDRAVA